MGEVVLCFESEAVRDVVPCQGFNACPTFDWLGQLLPWLAPRESVEQWIAFRQLIPYVVLANSETICIYRRSRAGGEKRLHDRWSIGFGGHIGLEDVVLVDGRIDVVATARRAADREVLEEFGESTIRDRQLLGVIVDDTDDVGRVHMGLVELWRIDDIPRRSEAKQLEEIQFVSRDRVIELRDELERWSQLCLGGIAQLEL